MDRHAEEFASHAPALGGELRPPSDDRGTRGDDVLEACFEHASVGLMVVAPDGAILRANPAFAALLGMTVDEVRGRSVVDLTWPEDRAPLIDDLRALAERRVRGVGAEKRYRRKDGTPVRVRVTAMPAFDADGALSHQLVTVRDITERDALAAQLAEANARLRRLADSNILGVTVATAGGSVLEANDELLRLAGITREQFERDGLDWREITPPEYRAVDERAMREMVERGACVPFEKAFVRPDGTRVPILVGGALLEGEPLKCIAFALDLTDRRRAEEERDRLLEEARVARDLAAAALVARDTLLGRVTHDLRTPIGANLGYAELMLEGIPVPLPPVHAERVRRMRANQQHMLALLDELLHFARSVGENGVTELQSLEVNALLADVEPLVAPQLRSAGVRFTIVPCVPDLVVRAERVKVLQILGNLIGNSVKFTPRGGEVTVEASEAGDRVRISVADTGVGIAASRLASIFEPFVQVRGPDVPVAGQVHPRGFGLGLAISRELARKMGGDLVAASEPGAGSTFTLVLPRG